jgi:hypothetical protein
MPQSGQGFRFDFILGVDSGTLNTCFMCVPIFLRIIFNCPNNPETAPGLRACRGRFLKSVLHGQIEADFRGHKGTIPGFIR